MMKNTNNFPRMLKYRVQKAIDKAVSDYRKEYPDGKDFQRNRVLDLKTMVNLLLSMQGGSLNKELHQAEINASASAFVQQRKKIPWTVFENAFEHFNESCIDDKKYKGYRVLAIDGTVVDIARNPNSSSFMQNDSSPRGYNQLHVSPLYDVLNKTYLHCIIQPQPKMDEVGSLAFFLKWYNFKEKTLIVADRGYESYNIFAHFLEHPNVDFLIRVKQDKSAMREIGKLPMTELDTEVSFTITTTQTKEDKEKGHILLQTQKNKDKVYSSKTKSKRWDFPSPYPMKFRVVRVLLDTGEYETLATSLPPSFTPSEIKELYHARWGIETSFRELKYDIGLVNLHGKSDEFASQEIFSSLLIMNFCNRIVNKIVINQKQENIYEYKINMKMAIYLCRQFFRDKNADSEKLIADISKYLEPVRPGRRDTWNIKSKSFVAFVYRVSA